VIARRAASGSHLQFVRQCSTSSASIIPRCDYRRPLSFLQRLSENAMQALNSPIETLGGTVTQKTRITTETTRRHQYCSTRERRVRGHVIWQQEDMCGTHAYRSPRLSHRPGLFLVRNHDATASGLAKKIPRLGLDRIYAACSGRSTSRPRRVAIETSTRIECVQRPRGKKASQRATKHCLFQRVRGNATRR
jgi:hypothetical protein